MNYYIIYIMNYYVIYKVIQDLYKVFNLIISGIWSCTKISFISICSVKGTSYSGETIIL